MTDTLNLSLWVARRAEQGTLQAHADYVVREIKLLEQAVKYEADLVQQALGSNEQLEARVEQLAATNEELEAKLAKAENLLVDAMVQLENGKIKTRRNRAFLIGRFLAELKGEKDDPA